MIRKFKANNYLKGRIIAQMEHYIQSEAIRFESGSTRNTCIILVNESKIKPYELEYMYKTLIPVNREINQIIKRECLE